MKWLTPSVSAAPENIDFKKQSNFDDHSSPIPTPTPTSLVPTQSLASESSVMQDQSATPEIRGSRSAFNFPIRAIREEEKKQHRKKQQLADLRWVFGDIMIQLPVTQSY